MNPLYDRNGNSAASGSPCGPSRGDDLRSDKGCRPDSTSSSDGGDNVIDFATGYGAQEQALVLMAKYWHSGQVKTRLAAKIGFPAAASLHELFTRRLTDSLARAGIHHQLRVSPDDCCSQIASQISPLWNVRAQGDGDLGQRMWRGFSDCFTAGASRVVMIGADLPTLCQADIDNAFDQLRSCDLVLGPAVDGGYYLIGLSCGREINRFLQLFGTLSWGTSTVLRDTLSIASGCGLTVKQLDEREDVDQWPDLVRLVQRLERSDSSDDTSLAAQIRALLQYTSFSDSFSQARTL